MYGQQGPPAAGSQSLVPGGYQQPPMQTIPNWGYQRPPRPYYPRGDYNSYNSYGGYRPNSYVPQSAAHFMDREDLNFVKRARLRENAVVENALTQSLTGTLGPTTAQVVAQAITDPSSRSGSSALLTALTLSAGTMQQKQQETPTSQPAIDTSAIAQQVIQQLLPLLPSQQLQQPINLSHAQVYPQPQAVFQPPQFLQNPSTSSTPPHTVYYNPPIPQYGLPPPPPQYSMPPQQTYVPPQSVYTAPPPPPAFTQPAAAAPAPQAAAPIHPTNNQQPPQTPATAQGAGPAHPAYTMGAGPSNPATPGAGSSQPTAANVATNGLPAFANDQDRFKKLDPTMLAVLKPHLRDLADAGELNSKLQVMSSDDIKALYAAVCDPVSHPAFTTKAAAVYWISVVLWQYRNGFIAACG
jgi:hypothetical protein